MRYIEIMIKTRYGLNLAVLRLYQSIFLNLKVRFFMKNSIRKGIINYARIIEDMGAPYEKLVNSMSVDNGTWRFDADIKTSVRNWRHFDRDLYDIAMIDEFVR